MRRPLLGLGLLLPLLVGHPSAEAKLEAAEWKQVESEYTRLFLPPPGRHGSAADKALLVERLVADAESRAWKYLGDILVSECTLWLEAQRKAQAKESELLAFQKKGSKGWTPDEQAAMATAQQQYEPLEKAAKAEREILDGVVKAVTTAPPALRNTLFARAKGPSDWLFRAAVVQLATIQPSEKESAAFLVRSLLPSTEKDPRVRAAALDGLKAFPPGAENHVLGRIGDPDWTVQLIAVRMVREQKLVSAIPALIVALERANLRMQEEIGAALKDLTGQNHEAYADVWARWWADNREKFQGQEAVKVGARPKDPPVDNSIYGVPIKSDRVLFVIDISGSMLKPTQNPQGPTSTPQPPVTPKEGEVAPPAPPEEVLSGPKIDVAKHELKKAVQKLAKGAKFSMVAFNQGALVWKEQPVEATPDVREEAYKWIRDLKPSGSTYSEGALRVAFKIAGLGAIDKAYPEVSIDTIMFLSDGAPTNNDPAAGKLAPFEPILALVREWNSQKRVVINCIAIDMQPGNQFMKLLAEENGGTFVDR
jgi:hypothetical protein